MAVDPKNPHVWYVAMAAGGLWKTTNSGLTFTPVFDNYGATRCAACSSIRKTRTSCGSRPGENTNLRSAWRRGHLQEHRRRRDVAARRPRALRKDRPMAIDPRNSDVVWVAAQGPLWSSGGDRGLYKTTDGGQTWKAVLQISENTGVTDVVLDPRNPDVVYAAAYQRRRHTGLLIGGGPEGAIYKSTDGGATFKKLTTGLPTVDLGRIALAISPQNPDVVYASITAQGNGVRLLPFGRRRRNMDEAEQLEHERPAVLRRVVLRIPSASIACARSP